MAVTYPLGGSTTLQKIIPPYIYQQYADDDNLQAFWQVVTGVMQGYLDYLNALNLPVYTGAPIAGPLLDWVGQGLYGISRPTVPLSSARTIGPFNTWQFNGLPINGRQVLTPSQFFTLSDDYYKRVLTWHLYLGDGKQFSVFWLKRRICRFLFGENGADSGTADTSMVSVTLPSAGTIAIVISATAAMGQSPLILSECISSGAVELPFQFTYTVTL